MSKNPNSKNNNRAPKTENIKKAKKDWKKQEEKSRTLNRTYGGIKMGTTFAPEEIVKARELRSISQKRLRSTLHEVEKLGIDFHDGVSGVMLEYDKYKALIDRITHLEEELDDLYLNELYKNRQTDIADDKWFEKSSSQNMVDFLKKR